MKDQETRASIEKVEALLRQFEESADPQTRTNAAELVAALMEIHGSALRRILLLIHEQGATGGQIVTQLVADEDVGALLNLYGLHPVELRERVEMAVQKLAAVLQSHNAKIEIAGIGDGVVRLRLMANGNGCHSSAGELRLIVEDAVLGAAPDVVDLQIEEMKAEPAPVFVTLQGLGKRNAANA